jgi:EVE domain
MTGENMATYRAPVVALVEQPNVPEAVPAPLTVQERVRLGQLIRTVERGLSQFLAVGAALLELRSSRLYRENHDTFENFCLETFGLARSTTDQVIRSASTAQLLIDNGVELPATTTPTAGEGDWSAVELTPVKPIKPPVTLEQIKREASLLDMPLLKNPRLSVMKLTKEQFETILDLAKTARPDDQ